MRCTCYPPAWHDRAFMTIRKSWSCCRPLRARAGKSMQVWIGPSVLQVSVVVARLIPYAGSPACCASRHHWWCRFHFLPYSGELPPSQIGAPLVGFLKPRQWFTSPFWSLQTPAWQGHPPLNVTILGISHDESTHGHSLSFPAHYSLCSPVVFCHIVMSSRWRQCGWSPDLHVPFFGFAKPIAL